MPKDLDSNKTQPIQIKGKENSSNLNPTDKKLLDLIDPNAQSAVKRYLDTKVQDMEQKVSSR